MRIVIKIGSNVLTGKSGSINRSRLLSMILDMVGLNKSGHEIVLISSGAVVSGKEILPRLHGPHSRKVWAAVGQPLLMQKYISGFAEHKIVAAQWLLAENDFASNKLYRHFRSMIECFFANRIIPILNGNDVMVAEDLIMGDNDALAALVAIAIKADKLILLTNQQGFFSGNPQTDPKARLIPEIKHINKEIEKMCWQEKSASGSGGMISKLKSARKAMFKGITTYIADGREPHILLNIIKGQKVGTKFTSNRS